MLTAADVRSLPRPTDAQWLAFETHLVGVHSWYKHLPLFQGGEFVVFLAPDAGENYPSEHPALPTENTVEGYRRAFGHLDYLWRCSSDEPFDRDGGTAPLLDAELMAIGRFTLYPYISEEFYWSIYENDVVRIERGHPHPHAAEILNACYAEGRLEDAWEELSETEKALIDGMEDEDEDVAIQEGVLPTPVLDYLELRTYYVTLHECALSQLKGALSNFRHWLESGDRPQ
jgi:hypothetical protein